MCETRYSKDQRMENNRGENCICKEFYFERNYHSLICELPLLAIFLVPASHTSSPDMLTDELITLKTNIRFTKMLKNKQGITHSNLLLE